MFCNGLASKIRYVAILTQIDTVSVKIDITDTVPIVVSIRAESGLKPTTLHLHDSHELIRGSVC